MKSSHFHILLLLIFVVFFIWSGIKPHDYLTWFLEVFPSIIGLVVLAATYRKFKLTDLAYALILIHACILLIGGHYTYAEVPLFNWIKETFHQSRNNYDKIGHFAQGFIPAIIARELLIRKEVVIKKGWLAFIITCICISISVVYEFIEWAVAEITGESADAFLGTQGYVWDTQSDMLYATIGAVAALIILGKVHDGFLKKTPIRAEISND